MDHRHLTYPAATPVEDLPSPAIVDILERGDLDDWRPIAAAIRREPNGAFAERVRRLLDAHPMYGTSPLWRAWIERCRVRAEAGNGVSPPAGLAALRQRLGLTQAVAAARMGISQSDLSKLERRDDVRLATLRDYAKALGGRIDVTFARGTERIGVRVGEGRRRGSSKRARRAPKRR